MLLHAERLELTHPKTRAPLVIRAPVPEDLAAAMRLLGVDPEA